MRSRKWVGVALLLLAAVAVWTLWANTAVEVNTYEISSSRIPKEFDGLRIAQVSDFHNAEFGEGNSEFLKLLAGTEPDIIIITGDLIDSRRTDVEIALNMARELVKIAPVYYVPGNHEARVTEYEALKAGLLDAGVTVLKDQSVSLSRDGARIRLAGIEDPSFRYGDEAESTARVLAELLPDTGEYTVLLSHRPELFDTYVDSGVDLVFSGHAHGGQVRLPLVGGLVAPHQGLFPKYDAGAFSGGNTTMLVSRGLGNSIVPIRFNNRPEIILAELQSKQEYATIKEKGGREDGGNLLRKSMRRMRPAGGTGLSRLQIRTRQTAWGRL